MPLRSSTSLFTVIYDVVNILYWNIYCVKHNFKFDHRLMPSDILRELARRGQQNKLNSMLTLEQAYK